MSQQASTEPLRIAVLAGGLSHERDISLRSGHRVAQVLKHLGHHRESSPNCARRW